MAQRGIKKKDYERLDDLTISRVVSLLEQENPITKKAACDILNISYNTLRLAKIIQEYKDKIDYVEKRRKANRGKPFSDLELKELIVDYLSGESIAKISNNMFRSTTIIKNKIEELKLPERDKNNTYQNPGLIPEEMLSETFSIGELIWSARYNAVAEIMKELKPGIYRIYVFGKHEQYAIQPYYELGQLEVLKTLNLEKEKFRNTTQPNIIYRID